MASGPLTVQLRINADGSAAIVGLRNVQGALDNTGQTARRTDTAMASLAGSFKGLALTAGAALSVGALAQSFIQANLESQRLAKGLTAVAGSATAGAAEMDYISKTADKLGLSLTATGSAYVSLTAATKGTSLEGEQTRQIFESVSLAMGKLGKSSADTQGALLAIEQMISKGVVSAEELRGQLGERLPGSFRLAAQAMGVTEQELGKMLEKGEVLAEDLLPALANQLNTLYNDGQKIGGLEAEWSRLDNAMDKMSVELNDLTGVTKALEEMLRSAAGAANLLAQGISAINNAKNGLGLRNFASDIDEFNAQYEKMIGLQERFRQVAKMVELKQGSNSLWEYELELQSVGKALGETTQKVAAMSAANVERIKTEQDLKQSIAQSVGDDAVKLYRDHKAELDANAAAIDNLSGRYDKSIAKKAEYAKMEAALTEAVKLWSMTQAEATAKLEAFAASQDKATEASGRHARALTEEQKIVASIEQKYGLYKGQLDAVWKLESNRGKGAGTDSARWVKDLAAGGGHMIKIVGEFQMAEKTAKGLGANMGTFAGQADAAAKYMAQAAAQGKTLWEQFAYYHGGPNEKAWREKTRAYADAAVKIVADATGTMQDLGQNTGKVITDTLNAAANTVQGLISRYLPARAATEEYEKAQLALAAASDLVGLSQEEQAIILQGLKKDLDEATQKSKQSADAWAEVWKNAVKRIDDTFANLWKDLFSGTKSTLESMKDAILSWLAEVAHALLTKPLVVAITTAMTGGSTVAGAAGTVADASSGWSGLSNLGSLASNIFSLGSTFVSGVYEGLIGMFSTNMFSTLGTAWGAVTSGSAMGAAAGLGVMAAYAAPLIAAGALIFSKWQKDQEPRYGAFAATTGRDPRGLEKWEWGGSLTYQTGAFGLNFGQADKGSANITDENKEIYKAFADVSHAMAQFYGEDVSKKIEASLKASGHILNLSEDVNEAFDIMFTTILNHGAATGDELAIVFKKVVGDLSGTAEEMANQLATGMQNALMLVQVAGNLKGTDLGDKLQLEGTDGQAALQLMAYADTMKKSGEVIGGTITRMILNLTVFDQAMQLLGTETDAVGVDIINMANSLAKAADDAKIGMQGLAQLQAAYYQNFYSEEERALKQKEAALKAITKWEEEQNLTGIESSADFRKYVDSLDLTTEAGQKAYVEAMKLVVAFISLDDALKKLDETVKTLPVDIEARRLKLREMADQLDPTDPLSKDQRTAAEDAMRKLGYKGDMYDAKGLAEFLRTLANMEDAGGEASEELQKFLETLTGVIDELARIAEQRSGLEMRLLELTGTDLEILAAQREAERKTIDESNWALLDLIYAREDELRLMEQLKNNAQDAFDKLRDSINAERDAINDAYDERMKTIDAEQQAQQELLDQQLAAMDLQRQAAQEAASAAQQQLSAVQSALSSLDAQIRTSEFSRRRAQMILAEAARTGGVPSESVLSAATDIRAEDFTTEAAFRANQLATRNNLTAVEKAAQQRADEAAAWLEHFDQAMQDARDQADERATQQRQQAEDWRDQELERLDAILKNAEDQLNQALGLDTAILSLTDAIELFRQSILELQINRGRPLPTPLDPVVPDDINSRPAAQAEEAVALREEIAALRKDMAIIANAQMKPLQSIETKLTKWDLDGLPAGSGDDAETITLLKAA